MLQSERDEDGADLVARVVEEYFERARRGERPQLEEFVERYPEISDLLRTVIPGLQVAEQCPSDSTDSASALKSIGDFNILREIGRGGMGIVYEAEQVSLGRRVALKVLLHYAAASSKQRRRFQREARAAARLHHTNIVPVFGAAHEDDKDYYVMQLIYGSSLAEVLVELRHLRNESDRAPCAEDASMAPTNSQGTSLIAKSLWHGKFGEMPSSSQDEFVAAKDPEPNGETIEGARLVMCQPALKNRGKKISPGAPASSTADSTASPLPLSDSHLSVIGIDSKSQDSRHTQYCESVARIGLQVASALHYAHDHSVLHRDIKPSNLILDGSGTVWVGDFGLAKVMDQQGLTNTGDILGTLRYMPPEAFQGQTDLRSDLYSLGITLYEMLVLRPAYDEADRPMLISQITEGSLERLDRVDPSIPRDLVTIVHKAIERDPADRYQSAGEMEADLASYLADEPIKARRISWIERGARWSRRNRGMTAAVMSIAALLILGTVVSTISAVYFARLKNEAEYNGYVSDIFAIILRSDENSRSAVLARKLLAETPVRFRNWEFGYLLNKVLRPSTRDIQQRLHEKSASSSAEFWARGMPQERAEIVPRYGIGTGIMTGEYNTAGTALVLTLGDGSAELYSLADDGADAKFRLTRDSTFYHMTSSSDDSKLVGSVLSGPAVIYDVKTSEQITISQTSVFNQAVWAWSPDQAHVLSLQPDGRIRIWDASTLDPDSVVVLRDPNPEPMRLVTSDIRFTESGDELWSAAIDGTIRKWSFPDGEFLGRIEAPVMKGMHYHGMSPDGKLAVATFEDGSSFLWAINWDAETHDYWQLRETDRHAANMRGTPAAFSRDGTCIAVMNDLLTATIYDVECSVERGAGVPLCEISGHSAEVRSVQFSPNGEELLSVSEDGTAKIWTCQPAPTQARPTFANAHRDVVFQLAFDPRSNRLLSGSFDGTARVWDLASRRLLVTFKEHEVPVVAVDFNAQGTRAASLDAEGVLHVWDPVTGSPIFCIDPQSKRFSEHLRVASGRIVGDILYFPGVLSTGLFTPDGAHVVAFEKDAMKVFRADDGTFEVSLHDSNDHGWPVFNHDSTLVAVLEMNARRSRVWDRHTGQLVTTDAHEGRHSRALSMVDFSPVDDKLVSGGMGGDIIVRNARTGDLIRPVSLRPGFGIVDSCRFSSDGRFVLAGYGNGWCQVTDAESGEVITTLEGNLGPIRDVRINPDGTRLLSWSIDDQAIVWDLARPSANQLVVLGGKSRLIQAHWSPDGRDIITGWSDGSIGVWSGATKQDLTRLSLDPDAGDFEESVNAWRDSLTTAKERQRD